MKLTRHLTSLACLGFHQVWEHVSVPRWISFHISSRGIWGAGEEWQRAVQTTCWVGFGKLIKHCWLECRGGHWKRRQDEFWASSGCLPGILDFFHGTGWESVPREQIWWKQKISWFSKICQEELWLNPGAKDHGKRGKLKTGSNVHCGCGWAERRGWAKFQDTWIPIWALKSRCSVPLG